jgi:hypothetical protein
MSVRKVKAVAGRRTKGGIDLEASARQILAHIKGEVKLPTRRIVLVNEVVFRASNRRDNGQSRN